MPLPVLLPNVKFKTLAKLIVFAIFIQEDSPLETEKMVHAYGTAEQLKPIQPSSLKWFSIPQRSAKLLLVKLFQPHRLLLVGLVGRDLSSLGVAVNHPQP